MKREFLQNLKVGDQPLPKEVIDAIMDENGRDIESAKRPFADYETVKADLRNAQDALKAFDGVDVQALQSTITTLRSDLQKKDETWQAKLDAAEFDGVLKEAITKAKGRNAKAISALLDLDALRAEKDQGKAIESALTALKKENNYLFDTGSPYAAGTGSADPAGAGNAPRSLADALRESYTKP